MPKHVRVVYSASLSNNDLSLLPKRLLESHGRILVFYYSFYRECFSVLASIQCLWYTMFAKVMKVNLLSFCWAAHCEKVVLMHVFYTAPLNNSILARERCFSSRHERGTKKKIPLHWATETPRWARSITKFIWHASCIPPRISNVYSGSVEEHRSA